MLKHASLVTDSAQGTRRLYRVDRRGVHALRDYLDQLWDNALTAYAAAVEEERA